MDMKARDLLERATNALLNIVGIVGTIMILAALARQGPLYHFLFG